MQQIKTGPVAHPGNDAEHDSVVAEQVSNLLRQLRWEAETKQHKDGPGAGHKPSDTTPPPPRPPSDKHRKSKRPPGGRRQRSLPPSGITHRHRSRDNQGRFTQVFAKGLFAVSAPSAPIAARRKLLAHNLLGLRKLLLWHFAFPGQIPKTVWLTANRHHCQATQRCQA